MAQDVDLSKLPEESSPEDETPKDPEDVFSDSDFMAALDRSVNGLVYDDDTALQQAKQKTEGQQTPPKEPVLEDKTDNTDNPEVDKVAVLEKKLEQIEKSYGSSSEEAIRLRGELDAVKPFLPLLDALRTDENLYNMVNDYYEKGGQTPTSVVDQLGLDENFVFDGSDLTNTSSDSYKVFEASVNKVASDMVRKEMAKRDKKQADDANRQRIEREKREFISAHGQEEYDKVVSYMKANEMDLEKIRVLMNLPERDKKIANTAVQERVNKAQEMANKNQSMAATGGNVAKKPDIEDLLWNAIEKEMGGQVDFSNIELKK